MKECWLSGELTLYHSCLLPAFAMLQQAVRPSGPSCQRNFISSLFPSVLIHVSQPWTSPPSRSTQSLIQVCPELSDKMYQVHGKSGCSNGVTPLIWPTSHYRAQRMTEKNSKYHFVWLLSLAMEVACFFPPEIFISYTVCCLIPDCKTNGLRWFR